MIVSSVVIEICHVVEDFCYDFYLYSWCCSCIGFGCKLFSLHLYICCWLSLLLLLIQLIQDGKDTCTGPEIKGPHRRAQVLWNQFFLSCTQFVSPKREFFWTQEFVILDPSVNRPSATWGFVSVTAHELRPCVRGSCQCWSVAMTSLQLRLLYIHTFYNHNCKFFIGIE